MERFYVLYLSDRVWQAAIDVMRLLVKPATRGQAHVTIRGPYRTKPAANVHWRKAKHIPMTITGVGTFNERKRHTVFLQCESSEIKNLWWKRDYRDGVPHITIYSGESAELASEIEAVLKSFNWRHQFVGDQLREYIASGVQLKLDLSSADRDSVLTQLFGRHISKAQLSALDTPDRLRYLARLAEALSSGTLKLSASSSVSGDPDSRSTQRERTLDRNRKPTPR